MGGPAGGSALTAMAGATTATANAPVIISRRIENSVGAIMLPSVVDVIVNITVRISR